MSGPGTFSNRKLGDDCMNKTDWAVAIRELRVDYHTRYKGITAIGPVSFKAKANRITLLRGPNGSGKSTVLRCIAGLQKYRGDIAWTTSVECAFMPQRSSTQLIPWLTIADHIDAFLPQEVEGADIRFRRILARLQWPRDKSFDDTPAGTLSVGQRQMVALALCLSNLHSGLALLDEPIASLDDDRRKVAVDLLREYVTMNGGTVLMTSHTSLEGKDIEVVTMPANV